MQNINHIVILNQDSPEVTEFVNNTLTPGLLQFMKDNDTVYEFISYFHSLGVSAEYVSYLTLTNKNLKTAVEIAIETCILRLQKLSPSMIDMKCFINQLKSFFNKNPDTPVPDSMVLFKPYGMTEEETKAALEIELKKREQNKNSLT